MGVDLAVPTVYAFACLDHGVELSSVAPFKATREAIEQRFAGQVLEGTAERVDPDELDAWGCYVRRPTGWRALDD